MGSSSKGSSGDTSYSDADYYNYGYGLKEGNARMDGLSGIDPEMAGYDQIYEGYMKAHNEKVDSENLKNLLLGGTEDSETDEEAAARKWSEGGKSSDTSSFETISSQLEGLGDNQVYSLQKSAGGEEGQYEYGDSWYTWEFADENDEVGAWAEVADEWGVTDTSGDFDWDTAKGYLSDGRSISEVVGERNNLISGYLDALGSATDSVNSRVSEERANAALMGVDYEISDESKSERISNQLADIWTESNQTALDTAVSSFGSGGFTQSIYRGTADEAGSQGYVGEEQGGTSISAKPTLMDAEDQLGGGSILGG